MRNIPPRATRRQVLKRAAWAALAAPCIIPATVLGKGRVAPSERITMAAIGIGGMGRVDLTSFLAQPDVQVIAVCDVKTPAREAAADLVNQQYAKNDCAQHIDWREVMARQDVDAILCATPDHWHALISIAAARAGKDIYCEKPMSLTIAEGRAVANEVARHGIVYQSGTQRRSQFNYRFCINAVKRGMIGKLLRVEGRMGKSGLPSDPTPIDPPDWIDYDMWLGPAPAKPYSAARTSGQFRWIYDYSGGSMTDMGAHYNDILQMVRSTHLDCPSIYESRDVKFYERGIFDTACEYNVVARYDDGVEMHMIGGGEKGSEKGMRWVGTEGWIDLVDSTGTVTARPESILGGRRMALPYANVAPHHRNFLDCVRSRALTVANAEVAHRSTTICHAANICMRLGRPVKWDRGVEQFIGDDDANRMRARAMRAPWTL